MKRILITPRSLTASGHPALNRLVEEGFELVFSTHGRQPDGNELRAILPGCIGYLAGVERISANTLEAAKDLRVISRNGTGIDNIDLETAKRLNIKIFRAEDANARGVAELTLALILASVRSICFSNAQLKRGEWRRRKGIELQDRTLGLVGCGKLGGLLHGWLSVWECMLLLTIPFRMPPFRPPQTFDMVP